MTTPVSPQVQQVTLDFFVDASDANRAFITWRSPLIGSQRTQLALPYNKVTLPLVIRALDAMQYPYYPDPYVSPVFSPQNINGLKQLGLWKDGRVRADVAQIVGRGLYKALGAEGQKTLALVRGTADAQQQSVHYALRFDQDDLWLPAFPWELLWVPGRDLPLLMESGSVITRYQLVDRPASLGVADGRRLHILALVSEPLEREMEGAETQARLQSWQQLQERNEITYAQIMPLSIATLEQHLATGPKPDIIHYVGWVDYHDGECWLWFDSPGDWSIRLRQLEALCGSVPLMVLNAGIHPQYGSTHPFTAVAPAISRLGQATVAMQMSISVDATIAFTRTFYRDLLLKRRSLQEAVAAGRRAVWFSQGEEASWFVPTLYIRSSEPGALYLMQRSLPSQSDERASLEKQLQQYRRNLDLLQQQAASYGGEIMAPVLTQNQIAVTSERIAEIARVMAALDGGESVAALEAKVVPGHSLGERWQRAAYQQLVAHDNVNGVTIPELRAFVNEFCKLLDFRIVEGSEYNHHNQYVACRVQAPTLHLNLPGEFPLIFVLEADVSQQIEGLPNIWQMMGMAIDFGLVLVSGSHTRAQQLINNQIRPAMKSDLIVLGVGFLNDIADPRLARTTLLGAILREVELTRVSPFMAGGDVSERMFFGREGEQKEIAEAVSKTSVGITCGRRIGKTTLLNRLAHIVLPKRGHPSYFLNCQPAQNYRELRAEMTRQWSRPDLPFDPDRPNSFADVAAALGAPGGLPPVFLLDEIDVLLRYDSEQDYALFRQLRALSFENKAYFVVTGERSVLSEMGNADSPLFNFFGHTVKLSFLTQPAVKKLVLDPLQDMQIELSDPLPMLDTIYTVTSCHPYLVQRLCQSLVKSCSAAGRRIILESDIESCLDDSDYQEDYFNTVWGQAGELACIITLLVDAGGVSMTQIRERLRGWRLAPAVGEIEAALDLLNLYSVLVRKRARYMFVAQGFPLMVQRAYGDDLDIHIELLCDTYRTTIQS